MLRLLRGEAVEVLSRELGVEPYRLARWREKALTDGMRTLPRMTSYREDVKQDG